ncbi:hypothetical protein HZS_4437 [Henneguya salminicola]|nr:hypothetical protein HZS_4437 [Henneguya salminicola]
MPLTRDIIARWKIIWRIFNQIACKPDGYLHGPRNLIIQFSEDNENYSKNIEDVLKSLKLKLLKNMIHISADLLQSHLTNLRDVFANKIRYKDFFF